MFVAGPQYLSLPRHENTWIIEDLLPSGGSLNIYGKPKAGKSLAALQMAACISNANVPDFLGFPIHTHGRVCYLQLDTPRSIWALDMEHGIADLQLDFSDCFISDKELAPRPFNVLDPLTVAETEKHVKALEPIAVFVDTIRKTHDGDEDKSTVMKIVVERLQLAVPQAALVILSHNRKGTAGQEDDLMSGNRGSNYLAGEVDVVLRVAKKSKTKGQFTYEGRTIAEQKLDLLRTEHGFWQVDDDSMRQKAFEILAKKGDRSERQLSRDLAESTGMNESTARKLIRELQGKKGYTACRMKPSSS